MIRAVGLLVASDLRRSVRSGFFLMIGIITPLSLAVVFNLVFGGTTSGRLEIPVALLDRDASAASAELRGTFAALDDQGLLALRGVGEGVDPATALEDEGLAAVVVVPAGYGAEAARPGGAPALEVVTDPEAPTSAGIVRSVVDQLARASDRARLAAGAAEALGTGAPGGAVPSPVAVVDRAAASRLDPAAQITAAMASLFMLIVAVMGVTSLLSERQDGTLARLLAAPIPGASIVVAKVLVSILLGSGSALVLVVAVRVLLGARWGPAPGVVALVVAFATAAAAVTLLVAGASRTAEAAQNLQGTVAVPLAILGGGLFPLPDSGVFAVARRLTPHHWFLDGLRSLAVEASLAAALPALGALAAFTLVVGVPGVVLAQSRLRS